MLGRPRSHSPVTALEIYESMALPVCEKTWCSGTRCACGIACHFHSAVSGTTSTCESLCTFSCFRVQAKSESHNGESVCRIYDPQRWRFTMRTLKYAKDCFSTSQNLKKFVFMSPKRWNRCSGESLFGNSPVPAFRGQGNRRMVA